MPQSPPLADTPRPQHLITTLFAMFGRPRDGVLAIAELISLMAPLGLDGNAVRSSVSRLKRRGQLMSTKKQGAAAYELSPEMGEILDAGDHRIFDRQRASVDDPWLLASFSVPERERPIRHRLRATLSRLGFGQLSGGLWIAPGIIVEESRSALERAGLAHYVELFLGGRVSDEEPAEAVRRWWDFELLEHAAVGFVQANAGVLDRPRADDEDFAAYVEAITQWRRLPYLDPGLPAEVLPVDWPGLRAESLFRELSAALAPGAERFAASILGPRLP